MAEGRLIHQQPASSQTNYSGKLGKKRGKPGNGMGHSYMPRVKRAPWSKTRIPQFEKSYSERPKKLKYISTDDTKWHHS